MNNKLNWTSKTAWYHFGIKCEYVELQIQHANRVLSDWIQFYNEVRPHQALGMKIPTEAYALSL